jgi:hypothetical protein
MVVAAPGMMDGRQETVEAGAAWRIEDLNFYCKVPFPMQYSDQNMIDIYPQPSQQSLCCMCKERFRELTQNQKLKLGYPESCCVHPCFR